MFALDQYALSKVGSMLHGTNLSIVGGPKVFYLIFLVDLLQNFNLGISNKLNDYTVAYSLSYGKKTPSPPKKYSKLFSFYEQQILNDATIS